MVFASLIGNGPSYWTIIFEPLFFPSKNCSQFDNLIDENVFDIEEMQKKIHDKSQRKNNLCYTSADQSPSFLRKKDNHK